MSDLAPEPQGPVESAVDPAVEPDAGAEPEAWAGPSQEEWEATQSLIERLGPLAQYAEQLGQEGDEGYEDVELDPMSDTFADQLRELIRAEIQPLSGYVQETQLGEAEQQAMDIIHDLQASGGEFLVPESSSKLARSLANDFMPESVQRYGVGPKAAEAALQKAVETVREMEQSIGKAYYERQMNQLSTLAGAPREPGSPGQAAAQQQAHIPGDERDLVRAHFSAGTGR